jgi:hypothetical protein
MSKEENIRRAIQTGKGKLMPEAAGQPGRCADSLQSLLLE